VRPEFGVLFLTLALETIAESRDLDAGGALVDLGEFLIRLLAGGSFACEFVDGAEDLGALDLSVHVTEHPDGGPQSARLFDDAALLIADSLHGG
jgi:hypothetical protein